MTDVTAVQDDAEPAAEAAPMSVFAETALTVAATTVVLVAVSLLSVLTGIG